MTRLLLLLTAAGLSAFYAFVAALAARPQVSEAYRDYYIDRQVELSIRERQELPPLRRGKIYTHTTKAIGFVGWAPAETRYRWSLGHNAKVIFVIDDKAPPPATLRLAVTSLGPQRVLWTLNGATRGEAVLDGEGLAYLDIEADSLRTGENVLRLEFPDAHRPSNEDPRTLALALHTLQWLPQNSPTP